HTNMCIVYNLRTDAINTLSLHDALPIFQNWKVEREIHLEITNYKVDFNKELPKNSEEKFDIDFHTEYINYLEQATSLMESLRLKDRKSTRLNSSHVKISYAVFCLKKKK